MYLHLPTFSRAVRATFSRRWFHPVHAMWSVGLLTAFLLLRTVVLLFRGIDHVLYPEFRRQEVSAPVYIIGGPRSGTTFLHRLISLDSRFTTTRLIDTIIPAVSLSRLARAAVRIDDRFGSPLQRLVLGVTGRVFKGWAGIHKTRLLDPEEDEQLFVYAFLTPVLTLLFPFFDELGDLAYADRLPPRNRRRLMRQYLGSIRRHLYLMGPNHTLLVKNTAIAGRLRSTLDAIPDMRVVHIVRHPYDTIASLLSMYSVTWRKLAPQAVDDIRVNRALAYLFCDYYRYRDEVLRDVPSDRVVHVRYEELVADPAAVVRSIYGALEMDVTEDFADLLDAEARRSHSYTSKHDYSLSDFGLSEKEIRSRIGDVVDRLNSDTGEAVVPSASPSLST